MVVTIAQHEHSFDVRHKLWFDSEGKVKGAVAGQPIQCLDCKQLVMIRPAEPQHDALDELHAHQVVAEIARKVGVSSCDICWKYFASATAKANHTCLEAAYAPSK